MNVQRKTWPMRPMRPMPVALGVAVALVIVAIPWPALAHSGLVSSTPNAGAALDAPPTEVSLEFEGELNPDGSAFTVTDDGGTAIGEGELDLTIADRNVLRGAVAITDPGTFTVAWTAVAADGHQESGTFAFRYLGAGPGGSPDTATALASGGGAGVAPAGLLLLLVGAGVAALRRRSDPS